MRISFVAAMSIVVILCGCHRGGPDLRIQIDHVVHEPEPGPCIPAMPPEASVRPNAPAALPPVPPVFVPPVFDREDPAPAADPPPMPAPKARGHRRLIWAVVCILSAVVLVYLHTLKVKGILPDVTKFLRRQPPSNKPPGPTAGPAKPVAAGNANPVPAAS